VQTRVYDIRLDEARAHLIFPSYGKKTAVGEKYHRIRKKAEFNAVRVSDPSGSYLCVLKIGKNGEDTLLCRIPESYDTLVDFCTEKLGRPPNTICVL